MEVMAWKRGDTLSIEFKGQNTHTLSRGRERFMSVKLMSVLRGWCSSKNEDFFSLDFLT